MMTTLALPWKPDSLRAPTGAASTVLVENAVRLTICSTQTVQKRLSELNLTEYYSTSIEVEVMTQRPETSDYDPFVSGTIWLIVTGRGAGTNTVNMTRIILASVGSDKYANREEETRVRDAATALVESDTLLTQWWHTLLTPQGIRKANADATEQARTDAILALMDEIRQDLVSRRYANPRKGMRVQVTRGRKVPIGTEGVLFWVGSTQFGKRIGFKDATDTVHWTAWGNFEFTDPIDENEVITLAKKLYADRGYAKVFGGIRN